MFKKCLKYCVLDITILYLGTTLYLWREYVKEISSSIQSVQYSLVITMSMYTIIGVNYGRGRGLKEA